MNKIFHPQFDYILDSPDLSCIVKNDKDFTILYANDNFFHAIGYSKDEIQYKYGSKLCALLDAKTIKKFQELLKINSDISKMPLEYSLKTAHSADLWLYSIIDISPLNDQNVFYIISHDISHYKKAELDLSWARKRGNVLWQYSSLDFIDYEKNTGKILRTNTKGFVKNIFQENGIFPDSLIEKGLVHPDYVNNLRQCCERVRQKEKRVTTEFQLKSGSDSYKWIILSLCRETHDKQVLITAIFNDITAEKEATFNYLNETLFYQAILTSQDAYSHVDITADKILRIGGLWNVYNEHIESLSYSFLFQEYVYKTIHIEDRVQYSEIVSQDNLIQAYQNGITHLNCEFRSIAKQKKMVWMNLTIELFENHISHHLMALLYLKNIDSQKKQRSLLEYEAGHDSLTNLYSRNGTINLINQYRSLMAENELCAVILFNIDKFRAINSQYGYVYGDKILVHVSNILQNTFRKYDIIGRFGPDEFLVLVKNIENNKSVEERLDTVVFSLEKELDCPITMSMGIVYVDNTDSLDQILSKVQFALRDAKQSSDTLYCVYNNELNCLDSGVKKQTLPAPSDRAREASEVWDSDYIQEFTGFLGEYGDIAYLVDPKTYVLLCGNQAFYDRIGTSESECCGKKCYELLHHRTHPCPFCGNASWTTDKFYMYRNYNEILEREFLIKNKLVQWHNQEVLFAVAVDLSNDKNGIEVMENVITEDRVLISGIQHMQAASNIDGVIESGLDAISKFFHSETITLWIKDPEDDIYYKRYICGRKTSQESPLTLDDSEGTLITNWLNERKWVEKFVVENREKMLCSSYELYHRMEQYGYTNQGWFLLKDNIDAEIGIIEINNITMNFQNFSFLTSFTKFIANEWQNRQMLEALIRSGFYDSLTGLLNRANYERFIAQFTEASADSIGVIFVNMDGLKKINNSLGYTTGNSYIIQLADILERLFPEHDKYRLSGDEFLVVLTDVSQQDVELGISQIHSALSDLQLFTVSVGYAWDNVEKDPHTLVEYATENMKINKARYHASLETDSNERTELLSWTMTAINEGRMFIYLQPKVDIRTNKVFGAEALVRYKDHLNNIISPSEFIHPLERSNLIRYVDFFVFEEVCKTLKDWKDKGKELPVISFNFSRITMSENDLITSMENIITKYGIDKNKIEVEITESYADIGKALLNRAAKNLFHAGYPLALDDFGTKYTNFSILSEIDAHILKIDRSLVHTLETDEKAKIILKNVITMCRDLDIEVIVEGVETNRQKEIVKELGCFYVQGFLYSKPIAVEAFEENYLYTV